MLHPKSTVFLNKAFCANKKPPGLTERFIYISTLKLYQLWHGQNGQVLLMELEVQNIYFQKLYLMYLAPAPQMFTLEELWKAI
jgi:hypothetical protein